MGIIGGGQCAETSAGKAGEPHADGNSQRVLPEIQEVCQQANYQVESKHTKRLVEKNARENVADQIYATRTIRRHTESRRHGSVQ